MSRITESIQEVNESAHEHFAANAAQNRVGQAVTIAEESRIERDKAKQAKQISAFVGKV
jgi:hypothetical protein